MKTQDLTIAGLQPLTAEEERNISGGFWFQLLGGGIVIVGTAIVKDWDNFKSGLLGQPERIR